LDVELIAVRGRRVVPEEELHVRRVPGHPLTGWPFRLDFWVWVAAEASSDGEELLHRRGEACVVERRFDIGLALLELAALGFIGQADESSPVGDQEADLFRMGARSSAIRAPRLEPNTYAGASVSAASRREASSLCVSTAIGAAGSSIWLRDSPRWS